MTKIQDFINNKIEALQAHESIVEAQNIFSDFDYSHFPILDQNVFIGSIGKEEAEIFPASDTISTHKYGLHRFFVRETMNWFDVFEEFSKIIQLFYLF